MYVPNDKARLYLLPVWLGEQGGVEQLPPENIMLAARLRLCFTEHERTARRMLRRMVPDLDLDALEMHRLDKDTSAQEVSSMAERLLEVGEGAIISEAGMPGIADPGATLVREAHRRGIQVVPLTGPSSIFLALAASGLNGQRFCFHGYLPRVPNERKQAIRGLEQAALSTGTAQIFMETPYRNDQLLEDLLRTCGHATLLTIAVDLTQPGGMVRSDTMAGWGRTKLVLGKRPAVFILGR